MVEIELEYTFLINKLPTNLADFPSTIIEDNYIPAEEAHPITRIRRKGEKYEITKKYPVDSVDGGHSGDSSHQIEHTISLTKPEYDALNSYNGKRLKKRRFFYEADGAKVELDVFFGKLAGLVMADIEFKDEEEMKNFQKPAFMGADLSQELIAAGGMLCGKSYADIATILKEKYNYTPVKGTEKYDE